MLLRAYLPRLVTTFFAAVFIAAGILTFGQAELFDRIFIGVLIFTGIVCRKDINVLGVVCILLAERFVEEGAWFLLNSDLIWQTKLSFYLLSMFIWHRLKFDPLSTLFVTSIIAAFGMELYWLLANIPPLHIHWYLLTMMLGLIVRHLIFLRVPYTDNYFNKNAESIALDWHIHVVYTTAIIAQSIVLFEFLLREIFTSTDIDLAYQAYPYLMHGIMTYAIWIVFRESKKIILKTLLNV